MARLLLSGHTIRKMQQAIAQTALSTAAADAVGGTLWDISRITGDGVETASGQTAAGTATAYLVKERLSVLAQALAGTQVGTDQWRLYADEGEIAADVDSDGLWQGRVITSQDDSSVQFQIGTLDSDHGYITGIVEKL